MTRTGKMLLAGLLLAGSGAFTAEAGETTTVVYRPIQGLSHHVGSKLVAGYFQQKDGACALSLFLAESTGEDTVPSASHVLLKVAPGENIKLNAVEGDPLEIKCGAEGATLEVKGGSVPARFASR